MEMSTFQIGISVIVTILSGIFGFVFTSLKEQKKELGDRITKLEERLNGMISRNEFEKHNKERFENINTKLVEINSAVEKLRDMFIELIKAK